MKTILFLPILTAGLLAAVGATPSWTNREADRLFYRRLIESFSSAHNREPEITFTKSSLNYPRQWSMAWSNHGDPNYHGPVAIIERAPDGNTIKEYPVLWRPTELTNAFSAPKSNVWIADPNGTLKRNEFSTNIEVLPTKTLWLSSTIVTNWHEWDNNPNRIDPGFYIGDYPTPQATWGYSIGEVRSNSIINLVFNGKTNQLEQSSTILGFIRRDWKLKPAERETTEQPFTPAKPFQKVTELFGRPEISYVVESTNLTVWTSYAPWITNTLSTNRLSLAATNIWK